MKIKKLLFGVITILFFVLFTNPPITAFGAQNYPMTIAFVGVDHSPLVNGDTETFTVSVFHAETVKYKFELRNEKTGNWEQLSNGFTEEVKGNSIYEFKSPKKYSVGKYTLRVTAMRGSDNSQVTYDVGINCVNRDDDNRVYAQGDMLLAKTDYKLGDTVTVDGIKDIGGIAGPYKYKLHIYDVGRGVWTKNVTAYDDNVSWKPDRPGTYVLDVHINTVNSTTWKKAMDNQNSNNLVGTYEAWKLKTITVAADKVPTGLVATSGIGKISLSWDVAPDVDYYKIYSSYDNQNFYELKSDETDKNIWRGASASVIHNKPDTKEYFKMKYVKNGVESGFSNTVYAQEFKAEKPNQPTGVAVKEVNKEGIRLTWDNISNADYFKVYRSEDGVNFVEAGNKSKGIENKWKWNSNYCYGYNITTPNKTMYFKVSVVVNGIESDCSEVISATTPER